MNTDWINEKTTYQDEAGRCWLNGEQLKQCEISSLTKQRGTFIRTDTLNDRLHRGWGLYAALTRNIRRAVRHRSEERMRLEQHYSNIEAVIRRPWTS